MFENLSGRVVALATDFYLIKGPDQARFPYCNAFLLTGSQTVLIDAGLDVGTIQAIDRERRIDTLVISHPHPDHILNWARLADRRLFIPEQTPDVVYDLVTLGTRLMGSKSRGRIWADIFIKHYGMKALKTPDRRFKNGDILEFESFQLKAIHAPGHLLDHYCFLELKTGTLLTSDVDFSNFGPFYGHPESSIDQFKETIGMLRSISCHTVCSSHKNPIQAGAVSDKAFLSFLNGFERHAEVIYKLCQEKSRTIEKLVEISPFYHNKMAVPLFQQTFEAQMILKCIDVMIQDGRMKKTSSGYASC